MTIRPLWFLVVFVGLALAIPAWTLWRDLGLAASGRLRDGQNRPVALDWRSKPELKTFVGDHFLGRDAVASASAAIQKDRLGVSLFPTVAVGRNGWLFFVPNEIDAVRGYPAMDAAWTAAIRRWFLDNQAHAQGCGARYLVVIIPCKATVYPDELPAWCVPAAESPCDRVLADLRTNAPGLEVLDLRPAVRAARIQVEADAAAPIRRIFQQYDTHWNDLGAHAAADALLSRLRQDFPAIDPPDRERFRVEVEERATGDLVRLVGLPGQLHESLPQLVWADGRPLERFPEDRISPGMSLENPSGDPGLPTAVLLRDSYAQRQLPFLASSFKNLHSVWIPGNPYSSAAVEQQRPQLVIHQLNERQFTDRAFLQQMSETVRDRQRAGLSTSR